MHLLPSTHQVQYPRASALGRKVDVFANVRTLRYNLQHLQKRKLYLSSFEKCEKSNTVQSYSNVAANH